MILRNKLYWAILIPLCVWIIPSSWIPIENLSVVEHRVLAIVVMAAVFWVLEPIPIFATSVLVIVLELILISDKSFVLFKEPENATNFGTVLGYKDIMATFASPIIMLFLGGFFLAMSATKYRLDINLARVLLKPFGKSPKNVLLGIMIITAVFSMFMSNTATTAMMLAILVPVLRLFPEGDPGRISFALAIPFAANVGGLGTPIGTPPNAIALKYLTGADAIGFGNWMLFGVPFVVVLLVFTWLLLLKLFPPKITTMELDIPGKFLKHWKAITVYITFVVTIILWLTDFWHGMNAYVVSLIPVAVFVSTTIITKKDLSNISWDVLWLVAGGMALGLALDGSGAARHLVESIPFSDFSPYLIVFLATIVSVTMACFMSHTATANLLMPMMLVLATTLPGLAPLGGTRMLILAVAISASLAMILPISTPPNALAHGTGFVQTKQMLRVGLIVGIVGMTLNYALMVILKGVGFF